jgi:hypothetical protein
MLMAVARPCSPGFVSQLHVPTYNLCAAIQVEQQEMVGRRRDSQIEDATRDAVCQ